MTTTPSFTFGEILRHFRRAAGLTQEALAERAHLSVRGLSDLEHDRVRAPRPDTVDLLVTGLRLSAPERALLQAAARGTKRGGAGGIPVRSSATENRAFVPGTYLAQLVGRSRELELIERHLTGLGPPLLLLAGEPGIGKTRLLQEATQRGTAMGLTVLAGGCHRRDGQAPYSPLLDALEQHIRGQDAFVLRAELAQCDWLVRLLPELAGGLLPPLATAALPSTQERRLLFAAVRQFLANVAASGASCDGRGTLLVLDDLQWAGSDALDLLATLVREATEIPLRVVAAYRDAAIPDRDPLAALRADLAVAGLAAHAKLDPLAESEAAQLLHALVGGASMPDDNIAERVLRHAEGVPFYLVSYAQALRAGIAETVPWDLTQSVQQRLLPLPAAAREVLSAAAVIGRQVPRTLLFAVAELPEESNLAGVEEVCRAGLLVEDGDESYSFAHDVIREVVEAEAGAARRALLHRRIAQALEANPASVSVDAIAYHFLRAGETHRAAYYLELAGDDAAHQRAHAAAEAHYREAMECLAALARTGDVARLREKLGTMLYRAGQLPAAIAELESAAVTYEAMESWDGLARVVSLMGNAFSRSGRPSEGLARVQPVLDAIERRALPNDAAALAMLLEAKGMLLFGDGQYGESLAAHDRAAMAAEVSGDDRLQVRAASHRVNLLQLLSRTVEAVQVGEAALPLAEAIGDLEIQRRLYDDLAYLYMFQGSLPTARRYVERACQTSALMGDPGLYAMSLALRAWIATVSGDLAEARRDLSRAEELIDQVPWRVSLPYIRMGFARLALATGDLTAATTAAEEAGQLAQANNDLQGRRIAAGLRAEADILTGHPVAAIARLRPLLDRPGLREFDVTVLLPTLAWAHLERGDLPASEVIVREAVERAGPGQMKLVLIEALRVQALLALRRGRWSEASCRLVEGLTLARALPCPAAEARLLGVTGPPPLAGPTITQTGGGDL